MKRPESPTLSEENLPLIIIVIIALAASPVFAQQALPGWTLEEVGEVLMPEYAASFVLAESPTTDQVILFGGSYNDSWLDDIREFTIPTETWAMRPETLPYQYRANERYGAAQASNGRFYVGPGNGPGGWGQNDQIIEVDLVTGIVQERAPIVAWGSNIWGIAIEPAPAYRGGVYLFGGWNGSGVSAIRHYDPDADQMRFVGNLSHPREIGAAILAPTGETYLFGGNRGPTVVEVFDPSDEAIRTIPNPDGIMFNHGTQGWMTTDGLIYLWNPVADYLGESSDCIIRFDPVTEEMANLGATPWPDAWPISAARDPESDAVYFFGFVAPGSVWGVSGTLLGNVYRLSPPTNQAPIADAGPDQFLIAGDDCHVLALLDGSASVDPDGDDPSFEWTSTFGTATGAIVEYQLPGGEHTFTLTVEDGNGGQDQDTVTITVDPNDPDGDGYCGVTDQCPDAGADNPCGGDIRSDGCPNNDVDGDRICNDQDYCTWTGDGRYGIKYGTNSLGCPLVDADNDTIPNTFDNCAWSGNKGLGIRPGGCSVSDADGDGLPTHLDACAWQNPLDYFIKNNGCRQSAWDTAILLDPDADRMPTLSDQGTVVDACPNTGNLGLGILNSGCPITDSDGDGMSDDLDLCPTEGPTPLFGMDSDGCPITDTDGDSVPDPDDQCPDTPGLRMNLGC